MEETTQRARALERCEASLASESSARATLRQQVKEAHAEAEAAGRRAREAQAEVAALEREVEAQRASVSAAQHDLQAERRRREEAEEQIRRKDEEAEHSRLSYRLAQAEDRRQALERDVTSARSAAWARSLALSAGAAVRGHSRPGAPAPSPAQAPAPFAASFTAPYFRSPAARSAGREAPQPSAESAKLRVGDLGASRGPPSSGRRDLWRDAQALGSQDLGPSWRDVAREAAADAATAEAASAEGRSLAISAARRRRELGDSDAQGRGQGSGQQ